MGDGWMHAGGDPAGLAEMIGRLAELRRECGRESHPFEVHAASLEGYASDGVQRLEEMGVTDVIVGFRWPYGVEQDNETLQKKVDDINRYADDVIARVRR